MKDGNSDRVKLPKALQVALMLLESSVTISRAKEAVCRDVVNLKNLNLKELIKMGGSVL